MPGKPEPEPLDPKELPNLAQMVIEAARFPFLATMDGDQPRLCHLSDRHDQLRITGRAEIVTERPRGQLGN